MLLVVCPLYLGLFCCLCFSFVCGWLVLRLVAVSFGLFANFVCGFLDRLVLRFCLLVVIWCLLICFLQWVADFGVGCALVLCLW